MTTRLPANTLGLLLLLLLAYVSNCQHLRQQHQPEAKKSSVLSTTETETNNDYEVLISRPEFQLKRQARKLLTLDENESVLLRTTDTNKQYLWINGWLREFPDEITASLFKEQQDNTKLPNEIEVLSSDLGEYPIGKVFSHLDTAAPVVAPITVPVQIPTTNQPVKSPLQIENTLNRFVREHKHKHEAADKRNYKIYYAIFAGRKKFMRIHLKYLDVLLQEGLIDEVHIWDFVQQIKMENGHYIYPDACADSMFLENYVRNTEIPGYMLFKRPRLDWDRGCCRLPDPGLPKNSRCKEIC